MDLKAEFAQLRKNVQEMRQKIVSLESELKSVKLSNNATAHENNAIYRYNSIVETISKWDMHFSGERSENMNVFLNKVEENCKLVGLSYNDLLPYLSLLFKGTASVWYQTYRNEWKTWQGFRESAREWYGDNRIYQEALDDELEARVQGPEEPVRDYLIHATALMSKQDPDFSNGKDYQLDMMYRNLRPEIKERMRREEFDSVKKMLQLAISSEYSVELDKRYRPMPGFPFVYVKREEAKPQNGTNNKLEPSSANAKQGQPTAKTSGQDLILTGDTVHELDILYCHMQPCIKKRVSRDEFDSLKKLLEGIIRAESEIELQKQFLEALTGGTNSANSKLELPAAKMNRQVSNMTNDEQLDILYRNMVPHIKERMRRDEIDSVKKLFEMIIRAEVEIELEKKNLKDLNRKTDPPMMHIGALSATIPANYKQGKRKPKGNRW